MSLVAVVLACFLLSFGVSVQPAHGQQSPKRTRQKNYPPKFEHASTEVYKQIGDRSLNAYLFRPDGWHPSDRRSAVVFFFGGGWRSGSPQQFEKQCEYLSSRGMITIAADYRVRSRHGVNATQCVADAKSAIRWVRANAARLGIDPKRIAAGGGSAGGHLAACTGLLEKFDEPDEDLNVSSRPNAMILFNPAVVLAPVDGRQLIPDNKNYRERIGADPILLSPYHHLTAGVAPTIILHGQDDPVVPYVTVEEFAEAMRKAGNRCELVGYEGERHGFFNFGRAKNRNFVATMKEVDAFLVSLGYLQGSDHVDDFVKQSAAVNELGTSGQ